MSSPTNSEILELLSPLEALIPKHLFDRLQTDFLLRESRLVSEKNELICKLRNVSDDCSILGKELGQLKEEYGECLLQKTELQSQLTKSGLDLKILKHSSKEVSEALQEEIKVLWEEKKELSGNWEEAKAAVHKYSEVKVALEEEIKGSREENMKLREMLGAKVALEEEIRALQEENGKLRENWGVTKLALEEEAKGLLKEVKRLRGKWEATMVVVQKARAEKKEMAAEYGKLKREKEVATLASIARLEALGRRVADVEEKMALLKSSGPEFALAHATDATLITNEDSCAHTPICISDSDDDGDRFH